MLKNIIKIDDINLGDKFKLFDTKNNKEVSGEIVEGENGLVIRWDDYSDDSSIAFLAFLINNGLLKILDN